MVDVVVIQCRFYKAGSGASLVPSKAGFLQPHLENLCCSEIRASPEIWT